MFDFLLDDSEEDKNEDGDWVDKLILMDILDDDE